MTRNFFWIILLMLSCGHTAISGKDRFILITFLYNETSPERIQEYITCLEKNLQHPLIQKVHILYDVSRDDEKKTLYNYLITQPIVIDCIHGRPTYSQCFELANKEYPDARIILANADIYFNNTLKLINKIDLTNTLVALTRWNIDKRGDLKRHYSRYSQDVWIFSTPFTDCCSYPIQMGIKTCDGRIARQAHLAGLRVINPCLSVQCCHLHRSEIRHYKMQEHFEWQDIMFVPYCTIE